LQIVIAAGLSNSVSGIASKPAVAARVIRRALLIMPAALLEQVVDPSSGAWFNGEGPHEQIAAKVTEVLADLILMAPSDYQSS
jgi:hypothetical protein